MRKIVKTPTVIVLLTLVAICIALVVAACGSGKATSAQGTGGQAGSAGSGQPGLAAGGATPSAPAKAAKTVWEGIKEAGLITVGNSPDYEPFEFEDGKGNVMGFDIDLLGLICDELGIKYQLVNIAFENIETAVQTGQVNIGMSCFSITPERLQTFDFSIPYFSSGQAVAVNPDSGYAKLADLEGKTITVGMGTSGMDAAEENIPNANIIGMDNYTLAFMQLKNKGADAAVADLPVVKKFAAKDGFKVLDEILSYEDNAILIKKGNDDLTSALNGAIQKLKDSGKIDALIEKWLIVD